VVDFTTLSGQDNPQLPAYMILHHKGSIV
jgi:hypothetical protein